MVANTTGTIMTMNLNLGTIITLAITTIKGRGRHDNARY
jgi:hypothetical protein